MHCASCGAAVPADARFCPRCGASQVSDDSERRFVTALFADLVGFTSLAEARDPEDVGRVVDRCFERLARDVTSFGGVVDKVMGDEIVALFGAPVAHEDDAERAVRAGLRMQQTLGAISAELDSPLEMRVGINTGEVLVGTSTAGGDYTAMGDVMNSASRLEGLAEPGQVIVGPATYGATVDAIHYQDLGVLAARGRGEGLSAWAAIGTTRPPGVRTRRMTEFIGRDHELGLLHAMCRMAVDLGQAQAALVLGEAGIGKTRTAEEAANLIANQYGALVLEGRSVPYGEANVWWPIADVVRSAFGVGLDTSADDARVTIIQALSIELPPAKSDDLQRFTTAFMHVLGYDTPLRGGDRLRNRAEAILALTTYLEAVLAERPVILLLSDMHWAADAVWELVRQVLSELAASRLIVMMTARSGEAPPMLQGRHGSLVLHLGPLDGESSRGMVALLGVDLPDDVAAELVARSGGNPFFLEELAGLVSARADDTQTDVVAELTSGRLETLPDTLRGIVAARLDALEPRVRSVLEAASVLGRNGPVEGLRTMMRERDGRDDISAELTGLLDTDLLTINGPRYEFRSDMVRDVAYGTLTKTDRALSHAGIAAYLEGLVAGDGATPEAARNSAVVAIADHYESAAQLVNELSGVSGIDRADVNAKALFWLDEAGRRAMDAGVPADAERWFTDGMALAGDDSTKAGFLYGRAKARCEQRDTGGARADLERLQPLTRHDPVMAARALLINGDVDRKAGDLGRAAHRLREAADRLEALGQTHDQSLALRLLGLTEAFRNDHQLARQALEAARTVAIDHGDRRNEAWALQSLGWFMLRSGQLAEASELVTEAERIFTELDDRGGLAWTQGLEAWVAFHQGDWDDARRLIDQVLPEVRRRGDPWAEAVMLQLLGSIQLWAGNAAGAWEIARQAQAIAETSDDLDVLVDAKLLEGRALVSRGRVSEGTATLEQAYGLAERADDADGRRRAIIVNCASSARLGESERAIRWAARFDGSHGDLDVVGESDLAIALALALLQRGAVAEAATQLAWIDRLDDGTAAGAQYDSWGQAVAAIVASAGGRTSEVERRVARVIDGQSTYLDRVVALLALAAARHQYGDDAGCTEALAAADDVLADTDDRLTPLLVALVAAICGRGELAEAEAKLMGIGVDPAGWRRAFTLAASAEMAG